LYERGKSHVSFSFSGFIDPATGSRPCSTGRHCLRIQNNPASHHASGIDLDPERYEFIRSAGIAFRQQFALKPGKYLVVLGVNDASSHKLGTMKMPIVIPAS
jgi:hypothetical protein